MSKDVFCYSLPVTSPQGRLMEAFWHQCIKADRAAEDYAVRYGATQYEQPVQYFAGGVDYLLFKPENEPNPNIFRLRHITPDGEKLYETLMTREERLRSEDMGQYFRVAADNRDLNYDKFFVKGQVQTEAEDSYTSHNTTLLDVEGVVKKILTTDYVKEALAENK